MKTTTYVYKSSSFRTNNLTFPLLTSAMMAMRKNGESFAYMDNAEPSSVKNIVAKVMVQLEDGRVVEHVILIDGELSIAHSKLHDQANAEYVNILSQATGGKAIIDIKAALQKANDVAGEFGN